MSEKKPEAGTIIIKKSDLWKYSTFFLLAVVIIGGFFLFHGGSSNNSGTLNAGTMEAAPNQPSINARALIEENDPIRGNSDASISIIEFSDFQCPFCAKAHTQTLLSFMNSDYFKKGEVNLIFKQFPLTSIHPYAKGAAEASLCAQEQGKFWEYHDKLFENQDALDIPNLESYAQQLNLDTNKFKNCLGNNKYGPEVNKEIGQANSAGAEGTPFFVIVNKKAGDTTILSGAYPWPDLEVAIEAVR